MEMLKQALSGLITGIVLLALIVFIFRRQEDKRQEKENEQNK